MLTASNSILQTIETSLITLFVLVSSICKSHTIICTISSRQEFILHEAIPHQIWCYDKTTHAIMISSYSSIIPVNAYMFTSCALLGIRFILLVWSIFGNLIRRCMINCRALKSVTTGSNYFSPLLFWYFSARQFWAVIMLRIQFTVLVVTKTFLTES